MENKKTHFTTGSFRKLKLKKIKKIFKNKNKKTKNKKEEIKKWTNLSKWNKEKERTRKSKSILISLTIQTSYFYSFTGKLFD